MTVPPAGSDILKEHAIYEFGYRRELDVHDFDYKMVRDQFVHGNCLLRDLTLGVMVVCILTLTVLAVRSFSRKHRPRALPLTKHDLSGVPGLSHSEAPTPTSGSPHISKDALSMDFYTFDDMHSKQS